MAAPVVYTPTHERIIFVWSHNTSAWLGIIICLFLLCLWLDVKSGIVLKREKRDWE